MLIWLKKAEHNKTSNFFFIYIKMGKEILTFGEIEIEKKNHRQKGSIFLRDVNIEKV